MSIMHHESKKNVSNYPKYYQTYNQQIAPKVKQSINSSERGTWKERRISTGFCLALRTLLWRDILNFKRNPMHLAARVIQVTIVTFFIGAVYWKLGDDYSPAGLSKSFLSKNGFLFFVSIGYFFSSMAPVLLTFSTEKLVFLK